MKEKVFQKNEVVFREGDYGDCFYMINSGTAGVYLHYGEEKQRKLTDLKPGQYFGEMAIIESWPRSTTIVAEEELHVTEIPESGLNQYFKEEPNKILALMKQLSGRIRSLTEEYDEVTAFLKEKDSGEAQKKPGFLDRLMKYVEQSMIAKKRGPADPELRDMTAEHAFDLKKTPLPIQSFDRDTIVFREGEDGDDMYAVHGGAVGIYTNYGTSLEKKLTTLYANSFFGEMAMIDQEPRSATAVVEEDDTVLERIRADDLLRLFEANPMEVDMIMRHLSKRLRRLTLDYEAACEEAAKNE